MIKNLLFTATLMGFIAFISTNDYAEACGEDDQACTPNSVVEKSNEDWEDNQTYKDNSEHQYEVANNLGFEMLPLFMAMSNELKSMMDSFWDQVQISEANSSEFDQLDSDLPSDIEHEESDDAYSDATSSDDAKSEETNNSSHGANSIATEKTSHNANSDVTHESSDDADSSEAHESLDDADSDATNKSLDDADSDTTHESSDGANSDTTNKPTHNADSAATHEEKHSNSSQHSQDNHKIRTRISGKA